MAVEKEVPAKAQRRRLTAAEKPRVLEEADGCTKPGELGALLRREGLYSAYLAAWREARRRGELAGSTARPRGPKARVVDPRTRRESGQLIAAARRRSAPSSPDFVQPSVARSTRNLSAVLNRHRLAFATTSVSCATGRSSTIVDMLDSRVALQTKLPGGRCFKHVGRVGGPFGAFATILLKGPRESGQPRAEKTPTLTDRSIVPARILA